MAKLSGDVGCEKLMGLTDSERAKFITMLVERGWRQETDAIFAPSRGLWFTDSHFNDWTLNQFDEIFTRRAERIKRAGFEGWEQSVKENLDAAEIAREILKEDNTQPWARGYK